MKLSYALVLLPCVLGAAIDRRNYCPYKAKSFVDTFDNPPLLGGELPDASPVDGTAGGALKYTAFDYVDGRVGGLVIAAPSPPYVITTGALTQQMQGQPAWQPINATYPFFDMTSLYLICLLDEEIPEGPTTFVSCTVQFTGVKAADGSTVVQEATFTPATIPTQNKYTFVRFADTFKGLKSVNVQLIQSSVPTTLTVPIFDSLGYSVYYKSC